MPWRHLLGPRQPLAAEAVIACERERVCVPVCAGVLDLLRGEGGTSGHVPVDITSSSVRGVGR